jgi:membrane fusion protein (multidrug efflux system)
MKYRNIGIVLGGILVLLIPKFFCGEKKESGGMGKGGANKMPIKVSVLVLNAEFVTPNYQVSGTLQANEMVDLYCETSGLVRNLYFKEGAKVNKGDLLLKINDADLQAQLKKALANKKLRDLSVERNQILLKKEAIAQADFDLSLNEKQAIDADIELLREQIRKTELRAPFSGTIGLRNLSEGAFVQPSTLIATLQDDQLLKLAFAIPEKYSSLIKVGDSISFVLTGSDKKFGAKIYARDASVTAATRTIAMKAVCNNKQARLMPGLFANITLKLGANAPTFMIPTQSLVPVLKGQKVFVMQGDSAVEKLVKTGFRNENKVEITEGLSAGDSLIVDGIMYMKNGIKVKLSKGK